MIWYDMIERLFLKDIWHDKKLDLKKRKKKKIKKISKFFEYWDIKIEDIAEIGCLRREPVVGHTSKNVLNIITNIWTKGQGWEVYKHRDFLLK